MNKIRISKVFKMFDKEIPCGLQRKIIIINNLLSQNSFDPHKIIFNTSKRCISLLRSLYNKNENVI